MRSFFRSRECLQCSPTAILFPQLSPALQRAIVPPRPVALDAAVIESFTRACYRVGLAGTSKESHIMTASRSKTCATGFST